MIQFIVGVFAGAAIGVAVMALCMIAGDARSERQRREINEDRRCNRTDR